MYFHNEQWTALKCRKEELKKDLIELKGKHPNIDSRAKSCDMNPEIVQSEIDKCNTGSKRIEIESQIEIKITNHKDTMISMDSVKKKITELTNQRLQFTKDFDEMVTICEKAKDRTKCQEFHDFTLEEHRDGIKKKCEEKKLEFVQKETTANENLQKDLNGLNSEINTFSETKAGLKAELKSLTDRIKEKQEERALLVNKVGFDFCNNNI